MSANEVGSVSVPAPHHPLIRSLHHDPESARLAVREAEEAERRELEKQKELRHGLYTAGRVLVALLFVVSGLSKVLTFAATAAALETAGIPLVGLVLPLAIAFELGCGAMLMAGYKVRPLSLALIGYLAAVTLFVHWDVRIDFNRAALLSNFAFAGALMMLAAHGAGKHSVDRRFERLAKLH